MSWEEELINLYEKNSSQAGIIRYKLFVKNGKEEKIPYVLIPPFHTTVTAQIQVTVSADGEFQGAEKVANEDKLTIIPVTEKSNGGRTSGPAPHPFCDNLKYLAGDYAKFVKEEKNNDRKHYELYMKGLEKWYLSDFSHEKVKAIYCYLKKGTLLQDLLDEKILVLDQDGYLDKTVKIQNAVQDKAFVRFIIRREKGLKSGELVDECWKDRTLHECFVQYYRSIGEHKELDYLTGTMQPASYLHSKKIRNEGDGAKLISSNDETNYTFKGRFVSKEQAFAIGNETSQKMHNALKWIIRKQGRSFDTLTMVTWESDMKSMPFWDADTETISSMGLPDPAGEEPAGELSQLFQDDEENRWAEDPKQQMTDQNPYTARQLYTALEGYRQQVDNTSRMILMAFDAATTGRLALAEFKDLATARYLENIKRWHETCGWIHRKYKDGQRIEYFGVPGVRDIADILYGTESRGKLTISDKNGKKLYAELARRLLPCIWDGRNIPYDLVVTAVNKASMPQSYKERYNWERVLALACSFIKKNRYERNKKEEWNVALNNECEIRDYLYGRLLAVADRVEYRTFDMERDSGRVTNAKRYMSTFAQRPFETWKIIEENLQPYFNKLSAAERRYYENLIDSICEKFDVEEFRKNTRLDGLYLLGFHSQSYDLKYNKKNTNNGGKENE